MDLWQIYKSVWLSIQTISYSNEKGTACVQNYGFFKVSKTTHINPQRYSFHYNIPLLSHFNSRTKYANWKNMKNILCSFLIYVYKYPFQYLMGPFHRSRNPNRNTKRNQYANIRYYAPKN